MEPDAACKGANLDGEQSEHTDRGQIEAAVLEERNRIAGEIHDTLGQVFTGILLHVRVAQRIADQRPAEAWDVIGRVAELAQQGLAEVRRSVWVLQPEAGEYADLVGTLRGAVERARLNTAVDIEMHVSGRPRKLPPDVGLNLLRIGEEAMTNAIRHGSPTIVFIEVKFESDEVRLRIQDDGQGFDVERQGFDVERQGDSGGFGLMGMGQRATRLGGKLSIISSPGYGTELLAVVPGSQSVHEGMA